MRKTADEMATELEVGDIHTKGEDWGDQCVRHIDLPAGADLRPLLAGPARRPLRLPALGLHPRGLDHTSSTPTAPSDVNRAGDLYYWPGGHTGWTDEGVVFIEFSPADEIRPVLEHLGAQLAPT